MLMGSITPEPVSASLGSSSSPSHEFPLGFLSFLKLGWPEQNPQGSLQTSFSSRLQQPGRHWPQPTGILNGSLSCLLQSDQISAWFLCKLSLTHSFSQGGHIHLGLPLTSQIATPPNPGISSPDLSPYCFQGFWLPAGLNQSPLQ